MQFIVYTPIDRRPTDSVCVCTSCIQSVEFGFYGRLHISFWIAYRQWFGSMPYAINVLFIVGHFFKNKTLPFFPHKYFKLFFFCVLFAFLKRVECERVKLIWKSNAAHHKKIKHNCRWNMGTTTKMYTNKKKILQKLSWKYFNIKLKIPEFGVNFPGFSVPICIYEDISKKLF